METMRLANKKRRHNNGQRPHLRHDCGLAVDTHRQVAALSHVDKLSENVVDGKRTFE